ncbi:MAG: hypothetical protein HQL46_10480 [Gammaproteobacteria bacterium]|nr:hypothetical protein [Gammaproteobacteria bacterium]
MISNVNNGVIYNNYLFSPQQVEPKQDEKKHDKDSTLSEQKLESKAKSLGVPEHIINKGEEAIQKWLRDNKEDIDETAKGKDQSEIEKDIENDNESKYKISIYI